MSDLNLIIGGVIAFIGLICCLSVAGAVIGVPLVILGALLALSRGN
jgi:hypothetical protein